jgi:hypothetical protein
MATTTSDAQLNANRENAQHSTVPRTEAGKQRARLNGLRHGLTGQTVVMPDEDHEAYETFVAQTIASLRPDSEPERELAATIANDQWRLNRARAIEENIFALDLATSPSESSDDHETDQALNQAQTYLDHAREIQLLTVYAGRIARAISKNKAELKALQAARAQARDKAFEEALLLASLAKSKGETYTVETDLFNVSGSSDYPRGTAPDGTASGDGFGFSTAEINRVIDRNRRLEEARNLFRQPLKGLRKAA